MQSRLPSFLKPSILPTTSGTVLSFQRSRDRLGIVCPAMFAGAPFIGEGTVLNLSLDGCLMECERTVIEGTYLTLRLLLPDDARALMIELTAVRWVHAQYFGIEFLRLPVSERSRLDRFLSRHRR